MNSKGKVDTILILAVVAILAVVLMKPDLSGFLGAQAIEGGGNGGTTTGGVLTGNPQVDYFITPEGQSYNTGATATTNFFEASTGNAIGSFTGSSGLASATNLSSNTKYNVVISETTVTNYDYYAKKDEVTAPTAGSVRKTIALQQVNNGTHTVSVFNADGVTNNHTTAQALSANDTKSIRFRITPAASIGDANVFGNGTKNLCLAIDYNYQEFTEFSVSYNGIAASSGCNPSVSKSADTNKTSVAFYTLPIAQLKSSKDYDFVLTVKSGSVDPVATGDAADLNLTIYDGTLFQDSRTSGFNAWSDYYQNPQTNAEIGATNITSYARFS